MSTASIIIVGEEAMVAADLEGQLLRLGYPVAASTATAERAIELARHHRPALVLVDIRLAGGMDGVAAAEIIRRQVDVPVVFLTTHSDAAALDRVKDTHAFGFVIKPFEERELRSSIEIAIHKHRAEQESRQQREWLRVTLASIGDAVITCDAHARITFLNPVAELLTGWNLANALGLPAGRLVRLINEQTRQPCADVVSQVLQAGRPVGQSAHTVLLTHDDREVPVEESAAPILDAAGQMVGVVLVLRDVTEKRRAQSALRHSEQRYRALVDSSPDGVVVIQDGRLVFANAVVLRFRGAAPPAEFLGRPVLELIHPDDREPVRHAIGRALAGEVASLSDARAFWVDGQMITVEATGNLVVFDGRPAVQFILREITERRRAEERLRLLSAAVESAGSGIAVTDRSGTVLWVNPAFADMTGYSQDEVVGQNTRILRSGSQPAEFYRQMWQTILSGQVWRGELVNRRKDGSLYAEDMTLTPVRTNGSEITHFIGIMHDVTARKAAEAAARRGHARVNLLAETASALLTTDSPQQLVEDLCRRVMTFLDCDIFFNYLLEQDPGALPPSTTEPAPSERLHLNACAGVSDEIRRSIEWLDLGAAVCGCAALGACRIVTEDVQATPDPRTELIRGFGVLAYACHPLLGRQGKVLGTLSFGARTRTRFTDEDLSLMKTVADHVSLTLERHRASETIRALNADLERRVRDRTAELELSNRELEAFSYSVSHDLRAPLRGIDGFSQALMEDFGSQLDAEGKKDIQWIRSECQKMGRLIDDLLNLSRLSRSAMKREPVDLTALAQEIVSGLQAVEPGRRVEFRISAGLQADGDRALLRVVLSNLLQNAWKYTEQREAALIELGTTSVPAAGAPGKPRLGTPLFFIRDNGVGFDMAYADKLFAPFQRLHTLKEFPGNGIGLATVQRIIHRHGGQVWAAAAVGRGATFYFTLNS